MYKHNHHHVNVNAVVGTFAPGNSHCWELLLVGTFATCNAWEILLPATSVLRNFVAPILLFTQIQVVYKPTHTETACTSAINR